MDTRRIWPEVVVAGFLHLAWIVVLLVNLAGGSISDIVGLLLSLQTGPAALVVSAVVGASFIVGLLTNRLLVVVSEKLHKPSKEDDLLRAIENARQFEVALEDRSAHKAVFRSASVSVPLITLTLLPWASRHPNPSIIWITILTGAILTILFFVAFWTQRTFHQRLLDSMLKHRKESGQ